MRTQPYITTSLSRPVFAFVFTLVIAVGLAGCGGGGGGGGQQQVAPPLNPPPPPPAQQPNNPPRFNTVVTVQPTNLGSGGGQVTFSVTASDPDNDPLTVVANLANAVTNQNVNAAFLTLNNGVFIGTATIAPNATTNNIVFNVNVQVTDGKVTAPVTQAGPQVTIQGLASPPPAPNLSRKQ